MARPTGSKDKKQRYRGWTYQQLKILKENYYKKSNKELSECLNKSIAVIRKTAEEMGLQKKGIISFIRYSFEEFIKEYQNIAGVYCIWR